MGEKVYNISSFVIDLLYKVDIIIYKFGEKVL